MSKYIRMSIVITKDPNVIFLFWWHDYDNLIPCILPAPIVCGCLSDDALAPTTCAVPVWNAVFQQRPITYKIYSHVVKFLISHVLKEADSHARTSKVNDQALQPAEAEPVFGKYGLATLVLCPYVFGAVSNKHYNICLWGEILTCAIVDHDGSQYDPNTQYGHSRDEDHRGD